MMEKIDNGIVVFGAGGHAKSVLGVLHAEGRWRVACLLEEAAIGSSRQVLGHEVLGDQSRMWRTTW
jgi:shikimate 5-dehydrogenase